MNNIYQQKKNTNQHRALAIDADHYGIAKPTFLTQFVVFVVLLVRAMTNINLNLSQTTQPAGKLKMQLMLIYAVPAFFIFGASALILMLMYLCIFELVLHLLSRNLSAND